ncbi:SDR family oxidoreductase [Papillibacter cinnamivorans]|uniref:3-oxoacyl-[acyl-carrier-protein] reductase n=1 Tax=Papillibacter cinnamivorans DSM 12816 TaxID=1122930 RepID=A0A1W2C2W6_9FIRM|nr:SDR family oxidoreductase [Papillibacter cinnamivorans]SMC79500.1 3-oxoacyl-[acyl-carrier-protein] reductase [Papillibacter cinnamivorans DSM 12816]
MNRLEGKICIVTGAAQGIGRAIAELFAKEGAEMVFAADMQEAAYPEKNIRAVRLNTTDREGVNKLVADIVGEYSHIDVVVNNAGITRDALTPKMTEEQWNLVLDVNLKGPHYMAAAVGPVMMAQGGGSIVSISSIIGLYGNVGQVNYAATKSGIIAMSKCWTKEFSRKGAQVRANAVAPGFILTPILKSMPDEILDGMKNKTLFKKLGSPEDIANAVLFLAGDESRYMTGQVLEVSGGISL